MKAIRWIGATGIVNLQLGDNPVLEITDSYGNEVLFNVTKADLEGISDILTDGRFHLKREEEKKQEELEEQELQKSRERFQLGVIGGVSISEMLKNSSEEIKAKLEGNSPTASKCPGHCTMPIGFCEEHGCPKTTQMELNASKNEENVSACEDTAQGGKEDSNG